MALSNIPEAWNQEFQPNLDTNLNPELKKFLDDKILTSEEAKALTEIFNANISEVLNVSKENLILLRETLGTTDKTTAAITDSEKRIISDIALDDDYLPLLDETNVPSNDISSRQDDYIQSVRENIVDEYDVDFEEISDNDFNAYFEEHMNTIDSKFVELWIDATKDVLNQIIARPKILLQIQFITGSIPDGKYGPNTQRAIDNFINQTEWVDSIEDILLLGIEEFNFDTVASVDTVENLERKFDDNYWNLTAILESALNLPSFTLASVARKESTFWSELNSGTGSKWMLMLTNWPFRDMRWMASGREIDGEDMQKVQRYQEIFTRISLSDLKQLSLGTGKTVEDSLPSIIWDKLEALQTCSPKEAIDIFAQLQWVLKSPIHKNNYLHTLNMICWSVYLKYLHENDAKGNFRDALRRYNNDDKVAYTRSDGTQVQTRDAYADKVLQYMKNKQQDKPKDLPVS